MKKRVIEACKLGAVLTAIVLSILIAIGIPIAILAFVKSIWIVVISLIVLFFIYASIYWFFADL